ncbi:MAG TPA: hypothetical protein ENI76_03910 [Ignavibacteria bacterium]|nr:hypothetical protein [Ignavibacteria bacterium]
MFKKPNYYSGVLLVIGVLMGLLTGYYQGGYVDNLLVQITFWFIGVGEIIGFTGHVFMAKKVAHSIGWEPSPFQFELGLASLGMGIAGILTMWFQNGFIAAVVIISAVFLLGAAYVHAKEMIVKKNFSPNNAGVIFYTDILGPVILLILLGIKYI